MMNIIYITKGMFVYIILIELLKNKNGFSVANTKSFIFKE